MTQITPARTTALGALVLAGVVVLSGCAANTASADASDTDTSAATEFVPAGEGTTTYPLTLDSPWGSTELTERPVRIAAVTPSQDDVEILAAIGVTPVLANEWSTDAWVENALTTPIPARYTTGDSTFPVEQIAKADPDLIIVLGADVSDAYEKLSAIAPVLSTSSGTGGEATVANDWETNVLRVGEALDLQDAAQHALDDEDAFFEDFRAEHAEIDGLTAAYLVYYGEEGGLQYHSSPDGPATTTLENMGFSPNPTASDFSYRQEISEELISSIDADVIVFSDNSDGNYATITEQPLFQKLPAVENGRLILIDNRATDGTFVIDGVEGTGNLPWALARSGPLSGTWAASQLAPALASALASE